MLPCHVCYVLTLLIIYECINLFKLFKQQLQSSGSLFLDYSINYKQNFVYENQQTMLVVVHEYIFHLLLCGVVPRVAAQARWLLRKLNVAGSIPSRGYTDLYYERGAQGVRPMRVGCDQSIGSNVSDAIVRSWLWSAAGRKTFLIGLLLQITASS